MTTRREFIRASGALTISFVVPCATAASTRIRPIGEMFVRSRLRLYAKGEVHLLMGKAELGQGIGTAMAQIVAEELDVGIDSVRLDPVSTLGSPDESYTTGSISVQQSGPPTRRAAATARAFLLGEGSAQLGVNVDRLSVRNGRILVDGTPGDASYWTMLENIRQTVELSDIAAEKDVGDYKVVGQSVPRLDIPAKVFGGESFLQDLRLPGMVHGRVVRPPAERARLRRARTKTAEGMPGVLEIVVDGTFVGVIAEREGQARAAAEQLRRDLVWNLPGDMPDAQKIGDWLKQARSRLEPVASSVLDFGSSAATRTIRATYQRPYQAHASISPSAAIARFHDGRLDVYSHAQGMYPLRRALARALGMQERKIDCHHREASGCFGHNGADDAACDAAVLARALPGTPVRVQWERGDEFAWEPYGSAMRVQLSADIDRDNTIRSWNCDLWSCPHSSRPRSPDDAANLIYAIQKHSPLPPPPARSMPQPSGGADRNAIPLYDFDNIKIVKHLVEESPLRVSALRGLGAYANVFAIESFMDELANRAREDPLAYRLRHLDNPRAIAMLEQLADVSGWHKRSENKEEGWGIAFAQFKNLASYTGICVRTQVIENRIRLVKAIAVCDAGLIINPDGVRAQIEGGIIQSSSWTLKEHVRFSRSEKQSLDWASYPILRFDEVPDVEVHLVERRDSPPLGVGEAAQGPTAAAIANAVFDQTGKRLRQLPLVLQNV